MARTVLATFPVTNLSGVRAIPNTVITDNAATVAVLQLDGTTMPDPAVGVFLESEVSLDGGATWPWKSSSSVIGGQIDKRGNPVLVYNCIAGLMPAVSGIPRRIQGTVTVTGSLTTTVTAYTE